MVTYGNLWDNPAWGIKRKLKKREVTLPDEGEEAQIPGSHHLKLRAKCFELLLFKLEGAHCEEEYSVGHRKPTFLRDIRAQFLLRDQMPPILGPEIGLELMPATGPRAGMWPVHLLWQSPTPVGGTGLLSHTKHSLLNLQLWATYHSLNWITSFTLLFENVTWK